MSRDPNVQLKHIIAGVEQRLMKRIAALEEEVAILKVKRGPGRPRKQDIEDRVLHG